MMITVRGLTKEFLISDGHVTALKSLDLDVAEGEFFVIVGASGSGKTTLLRCVAGLERPGRGEICIAGRVVSSHDPPTWVSPQHRTLGMVFQSYAVWPHLTVFQNVALPLAEGAQRIPRSEVADRVYEALRMVQLEDLAKRSATLLSGGQQQRVALARAIAVNSKILLMDEPLSNLDARLREEVRENIRALAKRLGSTVLYVTHDQVEALAMADRIALMHRGQILQVGTPISLYQKPGSAEVATFFGSMNWLQGSVIQPGLAATPIGALRFPASPEAKGKVLLGFRPECVSVVEGSPTDVPDVFRATLESSTFLGDQFLYSVKVNGHPLIGRNRAKVEAHGDGHLHVRVDASGVMVFPGDSMPDNAIILGSNGEAGQ
jgi:ABC-type sugar transport system ATPase subunit